MILIYQMYLHFRACAQEIAAEEHDVASGEVAQCADVVSGEAVASAFGGIPEDSGNKLQRQ